MFSYPVTHGYRERFFKIQYKLCLVVFLLDTLKSSLITVDFRGKEKKIPLALSMSRGTQIVTPLPLHRTVNCIEGQRYLRVSVLGSQ